MNRFKSLLFRESGQITVSPGDALYAAIAAAADRTPLSPRSLSEKHWAVAAVHGQIARGLAGLDISDQMATPTGNTAVRDNRSSPILRPHLHRIGMDVCRFGWFIAVYATDSDGAVRELVPLPPDEVELEEGKYRYGDDLYAPNKVLVIAHELPAVSPLEPLRSMLTEDTAAETWRRAAWEFAPRGMVERPIEAADWTQKAMERFLASLAGRHKKPAVVGILEEGMTFKDTPLPDSSAAQYVESRKLVAEAVASVYGVQGSLLATGQDKQLSQARRQLLNGPVASLAGLIEQQASSQLCVLQYGSQAINGRIRPHLDVAAALRREDEPENVTTAAVGSAWRTRNEQRRTEGLPPVDGGDELASAGAATAE